jgi:hypothetical protein
VLYHLSHTSNPYLFLFFSNSGFYICKAGALLFEPLFQPIFSVLFDVYDSEIEGIGIIPFLWVKK